MTAATAPAATPSAGHLLPASPREPAAALVLKPSLRAAASTFAKVAGILALVVVVPAVVAALSGEAGALVGAFLLAQFGSFAVLPLIVGVLLPAVRLLATRYELDGDGVRVHSSLVSRSDRRVPWDKVTLVVQRRGVVDRVLGIETVTIVAYGLQGASLDLVGLRDAAPVRAFAAQRMRDSASVAALFRND